MKRSRPRNGGNGKSPVLTAEQQAAFKSMVLLPKGDRREILDMVIMYELVEDSPQGEVIRREMRAG